MTCEDARQALPLFLYGDLSFDEEEQFESHLENCPACQKELQAVRTVHQFLEQEDQALPPMMLSSSRQQFRNRLAGTLPQQQQRASWWRELFTAPISFSGAIQPVAGLALLLLGFFGSRLVQSGTAGGLSIAGLADPISSRVRYVEPEGSGKVQIVLEETRQRTLSGATNDDNIRRLLLTAAKDPADPGLRVESVELLNSHTDSQEVRKALIAALQHDGNAGVRLKALEGLKRFSGDPETRQALAQSLLTDDNPGVRTEIIDLLIQNTGRQTMVGVFQELMRKEDNNYVRMRCQKALRDMNASVDTF